MNYSYLGISITQLILFIIACSLFPFYIKNSGQYIWGNISKRAKPVLYTTASLALIAICYMIYYCSLNEISDDYDISNKILFSIYLFLVSMWIILLIFYKTYKTNLIYNLIKTVVILYAICSIGLLVSVSSNNENNEDKIAITAAFFMALQAVVGDSIYWLINFPKLK